MKNRPSVKKIGPGDVFVRRKGRLHIINKKQRRHNQAQR